MDLPPSSRIYQAALGVSLTEYGILLGLVGVVGIAGLQSLGGATESLFKQTDQTLSNHNTLSLLDPIASPAKKASLQGGKNAYYGFAIDPASGQPTLQLVDGSQGAATNVSSIDGDQINTLGTMRIARTFNQLVEEETNPELKNYYAQLARISYYLGGAEGELDDVAGLQGYYDNADALKDVINFRRELKALIDNPPAALNQDALNEVMPLAVDTYNIANTYEVALTKFIRPDGSVQNFYDGQNTAHGDAGDMLKNVDLAYAKPDKAKNKSYDEIMSYEQMKSISDQVLANENVSSEPVVSTLTYAKAVDTISSNRGSGRRGGDKDCK